MIDEKQPDEHGCISDVLHELKRLRNEVAELRQIVRPEALTPETSRHPFVTLGEGSSIAAGVSIRASGPESQVVLLAASVVYRDTEIIGPVTLGKRSFLLTEAALSKRM
ncbi:hypothetical protein ACW0JT_12850 [Arthrobacter sp. SA17]